MDIEVLKALLLIFGTLFGTLVGAGIAGFIALRVAGKQIEGQKAVASVQIEGQHAIARVNARREWRAQRVKPLIDAADRVVELISEESFHVAMGRSWEADEAQLTQAFGPMFARIGILRARGAHDPELDRMVTGFLDAIIQFRGVGPDGWGTGEKGEASRGVVDVLASAYSELVNAAERYVDAA